MARALGYRLFIPHDIAFGNHLPCSIIMSSGNAPTVTYNNALLPADITGITEGSFATVNTYRSLASKRQHVAPKDSEGIFQGQPEL